MMDEAKQARDAAARRSATADADKGAAEPRKPAYQKPRLRKYDQVDQVKPYGPSEL